MTQPVHSLHPAAFFVHLLQPKESCLSLPCRHSSWWQPTSPGVYEQSAALNIKSSLLILFHRDVVIHPRAPQVCWTHCPGLTTSKPSVHYADSQLSPTTFLATKSLCRLAMPDIHVFIMQIDLCIIYSSYPTSPPCEVYKSWSFSIFIELGKHCQNNLQNIFLTPQHTLNQLFPIFLQPSPQS